MKDNNDSGVWPANGVEAVGLCPVCGSPNRELLHQGLFDNVFHCAPGKWNMQKCKTCESAYLDPRPTKETIGLAYQAYYTHSNFDLSNGANRSGFRRLIRSLTNGYLNKKYLQENQPASPLGYYLIRLLPVLRKNLDSGMRHLNPPPYAGARLLDLGCGNGEFLSRAKKMGWIVEGIDLDPAAVDAARRLGLDVSVGDIDVLSNKNSYYDLITCNHVIEHVYDSLGALSAMHRLLKPNGILWLETPNINAAGHLRFGKNWRGLEPPRHLTLFSYDSLKDSLRKSGFKVDDLPWNGLQVAGIHAVSNALAKGVDPASVSVTKISGVACLVDFSIERIFKKRREFLGFKAIKL